MEAGSTGFDAQSLIGRSLQTGVGEIQLVELIDSGGFAYMYRAVSLGDRPVQYAVKVFRKYVSHNDDEFDTQQAASINSERIVSVFDRIDDAFDEALQIFVMQWVDGSDLTHIHTLLSNLPHSERVKAQLRIAIDITRGLAALHQQGKAHRDLSLKNVLAYERSTDGWQAKLIDFGLSSPRDKAAMPAYGTPTFRAPERANYHLPEPEPDGILEDMYSLGVVLHYLFSGKYHIAIHDSTPTSEVLDLIRQVDHVDLARSVTNIPTDIIPVVNGLLDPNPQTRAGDVLTVHNELERILADHTHGSAMETQPIQVAQVDPYQLSEWQLTLPYYQRQHDQLVLDRYPLGHVRKGETSSLLSPVFHMMTEQHHVDVYLEETHSGDRVLSARFYPWHQYRVTAGLINGQIQVGVTAEAKEALPINGTPHYPDKISLRTEHDTIDLCFLIDGTMRDSSLRLAKEVASYIANTLISSNPVRVAAVFYGEYEDYPLKKKKAHQLVESFPFTDNFHTFHARLDGVALGDFTEQDICDALEAGLQTVTELRWVNNHRHLIILGDSPPHPSPYERADYKLLDFSLDHFPGAVHWANAVDALTEMRISTFAYLMQDSAPGDEYRRYIHETWKRLDSDQALRNLSSSNAGQLSDDLIQRLEADWPTRYVPEERPLLPVRMEE